MEQLELWWSGAAVMAGFIFYKLVRSRRRPEQAVIVGILAAACGVAAAFWISEPPGLAGLPYLLIRGSLLVFLVSPLGVVAAVMEFQHHRQAQNDG